MFIFLNFRYQELNLKNKIELVKVSVLDSLAPPLVTTVSASVPKESGPVERYT